MQSSPYKATDKHGVEMWCNRRVEETKASGWRTKNKQKTKILKDSMFSKLRCRPVFERALDRISETAQVASRHHPKLHLRTWGNRRASRWEEETVPYDKLSAMQTTNFGGSGADRVNGCLNETARSQLRIFLPLLSSHTLLTSDKTNFILIISSKRLTDQRSIKF